MMKPCSIGDDKSLSFSCYAVIKFVDDYENEDGKPFRTRVCRGGDMSCKCFVLRRLFELAAPVQLSDLHSYKVRDFLSADYVYVCHSLVHCALDVPVMYGDEKTYCKALTVGKPCACQKLVQWLLLFNTCLILVTYASDTFCFQIFNPGFCLWWGRP